MSTPPQVLQRPAIGPPAAYEAERPPRPATRRLGLLVGVPLLLLAALAVGLAGFSAGLAVAYQGRVLPGVTVGGVSLTGLDRAGAEARLHALLPDPGAVPVTIRAGGFSVVRRASDLGRDFDLEAALDAALAAGRGADPLATASGELGLLLHGRDVGWTRQSDQRAVAMALAELDLASRQAPVDASVAKVAAGASSVFVVVPSRAGRDLDLVAGATAITSALRDSSEGAITVEVPTLTVAPAVTDAVASQAAGRANHFSARPLSLVLDDATALAIDTATIEGWIGFGPGADGPYLATLDPAAVRASVASLAPKVDRPAKNATFAVQDGQVVAVIASTDGRALDVDGTVAAIVSSFGDSRYEGWGPSVTAALVLTPPAKSSKGLDVPNLSLLGAWTVPFVPGPNNFYGNNIRIPARELNGTVIGAGAWFSFWGHVRLDASLGFGPGGAIINGHTQPTGAWAGGICSASTTLFNAAARAGLEIGARSAHYYYITRYPLGLDATVALSGGSSQDMTFRNDTAHPILIMGSSTTTSVTFQIWGVPDGRTTSFSSPVVKNRVPAGDGVEYTTTLPTGVRQRIEYPAPGMDVWVTRVVRASDGSLLHQETFYSPYHKVDGLTLIGQ